MAIRRRRLAFVAIASSIVLLILHLRDPNGVQILPGLFDFGTGEKGSHRGSNQGQYADERPPQPQSALYLFPAYIPLPKPSTGRQLSLPRIQHGAFQSQSPAARETRQARLAAIKEAMQHSWNGYRAKAWMKDELAPVTGGHRTTLYGWAVTLVDALDTLWLMGMKDEFEEAVQAVAGVDFDTPATLPINVFETTIRYLGGLLGAYDVSGGKYPVLLRKAKEVGDMLYVAFETPSRMPVTRWSKIGVEVAAGDALVAELGSLSLEFTRLSQLTGDPKFYDAVQRVTDCLDAQQGQTKAPGLFPHKVNARECYFGDGVTFSIGGSADSVYEYFAKEYQLLGGGTEQYKRLYQNAVGPMKESILFKPMTPNNEDILMAGTLKVFRPGRKEFIPETQHLACFAGGMFAAGAKLFESSDDLATAEKLVRGCIWAYNQTDIGIMPEMFNVVPCPNDGTLCTWDEKVWARDMLSRNSHDESPQDKMLPEDERLRQKAQRLRLPKGISAMASRGYELRPEAIESMFILYRVTGDESLRETAWTIFESITKHARTEWGFASIQDVTQPDRKTDRMESFWMAETLKYFWLVFEDPDVVSLDDFVLNTEAHPFRLPQRRKKWSIW